MNTETVAMSIAERAEEEHNTQLDPLIISAILQTLLTCWGNVNPKERFEAMSPKQQERHVRVAMKREYRRRKVEISEDDLRVAAKLTTEAILAADDDDVAACYEGIEA